jgi:autotransporter-associated beta strand protein
MATAVLNTSGVVVAINVTNPGSGYDVPPLVSLPAPPLEQAAAGAVVSGGVVTAIDVTDGGAGYQNPPHVSITGGGPNATGATATALLVNGVVTAVEIDNAGTGYTTAPLVTIDPPALTATAIPDLTQGGVSGLTITRRGAGYTFAPTITFSGGGGSGASATAIVTNGVVTGYILNSSGSGYSSPPTVTFSDPATTAMATATIDNYKVQSITVVSGGSGYSSTHPPAVTISGGSPAITATASINAAGVKNGAVTGIFVTNPGAGFESTPTVTIAPAPPPVLGLTVSGGGTVALLADNSAITGPTNVNGGTLMLGSNRALGSGTLNLTAGTLTASAPVSLSNVVNFNNAQITFAGDNSITLSSSSSAGITLTNNTTLTASYSDNASAVTTLASAITGTGSMTLASGSLANPATFALKGSSSTGASPSTYTGLTTIVNNAVVQLLGNSALGAAAATGGTVVTSGSTLLLGGGVTIGNEPLTLYGNGNDAIRNLAGSSTWQGPILLLPGPDGLRKTTIDVAEGQLTFSGATSGVADLYQTGTGNLTLSGTSSFTGQTVVAQGGLSIASAQALGSLLGGTTVESGAALSIAKATTIAPELLTLSGAGTVNGVGATARTGALYARLASTWAGNIILDGGASIGGTAALTITGNISGSDLTVNGLSGLTLNAAETFTRGLTLSSGTLTVSNASANAGPTLVGPGTTLTLNNAGTLLETASISVNGGTLTLDDSSNGFNLGDRLAPQATVTFSGGAFSVNGASPAGITSGTLESFGPLVLATGNTVITSTAGSTSGSTLVLSSPSLTRMPGASVNFVGINGALQPIMPLDLPVRVRPWELTVYPRSHIRRRLRATWSAQARM